MALGLALLLASATTFAAASAQAAPPRERLAQTADSLTLFQALMPVLTSPRCFNCHGGTEPVSGANHGGGAVGQNAVCQQCHTASDDWQSVSGIKFDTNVVGMCNTLRHVVQVLGPSAFVSFLDSDPVVGLGFDGLRGMDENSPFWPLDPETPPIDRGEFVQRANAWVTQGKAQCGSGWTGSISYTQRFTSVSAGYDAGETTIIDIALADDQATAHVVDNKHETTDAPAANGGCGSFRHNTGNAIGDVPATVNIVVSDDAYQIMFNVPAVTGTWNVDTLNVGGCTAGHVSRAEQYPVTATFTIQGKLNPDDPKHLTGSYGNTDASPLKTTVTWNLNLADD